MRLRKKAVENFFNLHKEIREVVKTSNITHVSIYQEIGMSKTLYYEKLKEHSFNALEMGKIIEIVNREIE